MKQRKQWQVNRPRGLGFAVRSPFFRLACGTAAAAENPVSTLTLVTQVSVMQTLTTPSTEKEFARLTAHMFLRMFLASAFWQWATLSLRAKRGIRVFAATLQKPRSLTSFGMTEAAKPPTTCVLGSDLIHCFQQP